MQKVPRTGLKSSSKGGSGRGGMFRLRGKERGLCEGCRERLSGFWGREGTGGWAKRCPVVRSTWQLTHPVPFVGKQVGQGTGPWGRKELRFYEVTDGPVLSRGRRGQEERRPENMVPLRVVTVSSGSLEECGLQIEEPHTYEAPWPRPACGLSLPLHLLL